jgi:acetoin utilization protein AcuB
MHPMKPTVRTYMTASPLTIGRAQTLSAANETMKAHGIRHLPVLEDGKLVGVLSMREVQLIEGLTDIDPGLVLVDMAMRRQPYTVSPDALVEDVSREMAAKKLGSAVVLEGPAVVGVFTTIDALHALTELLEASRKDDP